MKKFVSLFLCAILCMSLVACGGKEEAPAASGGEAAADINVYVGVEEPLTGANASLGTAEYNAIELCIEMLNEKGGVMGKYPIS